MHFMLLANLRVATNNMEIGEVQINNSTTQSDTTTNTVSVAKKPVLGFLGLHPGFVERPNLTVSGISISFRLLAVLGRHSSHQINIRYCSFTVSFIIC